MTVTVSMPWHGAPEFLERAARSVLAQSVTDLRLVVVGDGEPPPLRIADPRLVLYTLPRNRGTYFAHQLVLTATPDAWFAPHDADDWTDPDHLARLMAPKRDAVVPGVLCFHEARHHRTGNRPDGGLFEHRAIGWHVGLFAVGRLRAIGGYEPDTRLSQDTHVLRLLDLTGGCLRLRGQPTYHRNKRAGSLTTAKATGLRSQARAAARMRNRARLVTCRHLRTIARIRQYRDGLTSAETHAALAEHAEILRERLGT